MRIEAGPGVRGWKVWHCEACKAMTNVTMVDDELNLYQVLLLPKKVTYKAKKIVIMASCKLILINPVGTDIDQSKIPHALLAS